MNTAKKIKFEFQPYQSSRADAYNEESSPCVGGVSLSSNNATILGGYKYEKHTVLTFSFRPIKHYELRSSLYGLTAASFMLTGTDIHIPFQHKPILPPVNKLRREIVLSFVLPFQKKKICCTI